MKGENIMVTLGIILLIIGLLVNTGLPLTYIGLALIVIGLILLPLLGLYALINLIMGAVAASKGEFRPYPFTLRLLS